MVTRDSDALLIEKWADTADAGNIAAPSTVGLTQTVGYPSSYKTPGGDNPEMEIIQWLWRAWSGMLVELNVHGLLVWNCWPVLRSPRDGVRQRRHALRFRAGQHRRGPNHRHQRFRLDAAGACRRHDL